MSDALENNFERQFLLMIAARLAARFPPQGRVARLFLDWARQTDLGLNWLEINVPDSGPTGCRDIWEGFRRSLEHERAASSAAEPDYLQQNIILLVRHLDLGKNNATSRVLTLLVRAAVNGPLYALSRTLETEAHLPTAAQLSAMTGLPRVKIGEILGRKGALAKSGLLQSDAITAQKGVPDLLDPCLLAALQEPANAIEDLLAPYLEKLTPTRAEWADFAGLEHVAEIAARLLKTAIEQRPRGVNLLVYGDAGVGKATFCKTLADHVGARLLALSAPRARWGETLRLVQRALENRPRTAVLIKVSGGFRARHGKSDVLSLLADNPHPTIWICRDPSVMDADFLQLMDMAINVKLPDAAIRAGIWKRLSADAGLLFDDPTCAWLAGELNASPALITRSLHLAGLTRATAPEVLLIARGLENIVAAESSPGKIPLSAAYLTR